MEDGSEKALRLKAQRSELQKKLEDWENTWQIIHGFPATDHDRHKSHEHRELSRLLVDVDEYVSALERGTANTVAPSVASKDAERRAERGRIKARMRRWEKDFERRMGRKPTEADIEASGEMESYRQQLKSINAGGASSTSDGGKASPEAAAAAAASGGAAAFVGGGKPLAPSAASAFDAPTEWAKGSDYHELLRARVSSHSSVNGCGPRLPHHIYMPAGAPSCSPLIPRPLSHFAPTPSHGGARCPTSLSTLSPSACLSASRV
jgi:hypothetical protein